MVFYRFIYIFIFLFLMPLVSHADMSPVYTCTNVAYPNQDLQVAFNVRASVEDDYYIITPYETRFTPLLITNMPKSLIIKSDASGVVSFNIFSQSNRTYVVSNLTCEPSASSLWGIASNLSFIAGLIVVIFVTKMILMLF